MKVIKAVLIEMGNPPKRGKAQKAQAVIVGLSSEFGFPGPERIMSINRHLERKPFGWVGNNTNYRAPGLNDAAEKRVADAGSNLEHCKRKLAELESQLKNFAENNAKLANPLEMIQAEYPRLCEFIR